MLQRHPDDDLLSLAAAAALLGVTPRVLANMAARGTLPPDVPHPPRWNPNHVEDWVNGLPPAPPPINSPQPPTGSTR